MLSQTIFPSPIGDLVAVADSNHLLMLEFADSKGFEEKLSVIANHFSATVKSDDTRKILTQTQKELEEYFSGTRKNFSIPLATDGTKFQKKAWKALEKIPYGETRSYKEEATLAGNPKAVRAIGGANHKNPIPIIIPCHRVVGADGSLVGYAGGIQKKIWLLEHEKKYR